MSVVLPIGNTKLPPGTGPERVGVLLVNLGTPDTANAAGVRLYLKEFLSDPRVIEDQGLLWKVVLNGIILRTRPRTKARDYLKIWNVERDESPLKTITRSQAEKLAAALSERAHVTVDWAMRYGNPSIQSRIDALPRGLRPNPPGAALSAICGGDDGDRVRQGVRRSSPGCAGSRRCASRRHYDDPVYIEALAPRCAPRLARLDFSPR